jgi:hypothetical protein
VAFAWEALHVGDEPVMVGSLGLSGSSLRCKMGTLDVMVECSTDYITDALTNTKMVAPDGIIEILCLSTDSFDGPLLVSFFPSPEIDYGGESS